MKKYNWDYRTKETVYRVKDGIAFLHFETGKYKKKNIDSWIEWIAKVDLETNELLSVENWDFDNIEKYSQPYEVEWEHPNVLFEQLDEHLKIGLELRITAQEFKAQNDLRMILNEGNYLNEKYVMEHGITGDWNPMFDPFI